MTECKLLAEDVQLCEDIDDVERFINSFRAIYDSINAYNQPNKKTLLHWAVSSKKTWLVERILQESEIDVNAVDSAHETALISACRNGCAQIVRLLAERGADTEIFDYNDDSALLWACYNRHIGIVEFLVDEMGADVDHLYKDGRNALMWSCKQDCFKLVSFLYFKTERPNWEDMNGQTAYCLAKSAQIKTFIETQERRRKAALAMFYFQKRDHVLFEKFTLTIVFDYLSFP